MDAVWTILSYVVGIGVSIWGIVWIAQSFDHFVTQLFYQCSPKELARRRYEAHQRAEEKKANKAEYARKYEKRLANDAIAIPDPAEVERYALFGYYDEMRGVYKSHGSYTFRIMKNGEIHKTRAADKGREFRRVFESWAAVVAYCRAGAALKGKKLGVEYYTDAAWERTADVPVSDSDIPDMWTATPIWTTREKYKEMKSWLSANYRVWTDYNDYTPNSPKWGNGLICVELSFRDPSVGTMVALKFQ